MLEEPLLAESSRLRQTVVGLVHRAVEGSAMDEPAQVTEFDDRVRDQSSLDADVLWVGQRGAQIEVADVIRWSTSWRSPRSSR